MVIVESCINSSIPYLLFEILRAVERVHVRRVEDGAADSEVHIRSPEITFQDSGDRTGDTSVSGWIFRMIWSGAERHPRRVGNRGGIPVYASVLNRCYRSPKTKVVLGIYAADEGVGEGGPHHRK